MNYEPLETSEEDWLLRVFQNYPIYLVKENEVAFVEFPFDTRNRKIGIRRASGRIESWYINSNGTGFNHSQCLLPIKGHLSDSPFEKPNQLEKLETRLARLEKLLFSWTVRKRGE